MKLTNVKVAAVKHDGHCRKKVRDLDSMCASIEEHGLLQPIGVDSKKNLLFGLRRLSAFKKMGRVEIPAIVLDLDSLASLYVQRDENAERLDIDDDDKLHLAALIRAKIKERRGRPDLAPKSENGQKPSLFSNCGQLATINSAETEEPQEGERTRDHVAQAAGFQSTAEMRRKEAVKAKAPAEIWQAVKDDVVSVSDAEKVLDQPAEVQLKALGLVKAGEAKTLVAGLKEPKAGAAAKAAIRLATSHEANEDSEPEVDAYGRVIPSRLSQVVVDGRATAAFCRDLAEYLKLLKAIKLDKDRAAHLQVSVETMLVNLKHALEANTFHSVCVYCEGKKSDCVPCKGAGWINKTICAAAPPEKRKAV